MLLHDLLCEAIDLLAADGKVPDVVRRYNLDDMQYDLVGEIDEGGHDGCLVKGKCEGVALRSLTRVMEPVSLNVEISLQQQLQSEILQVRSVLHLERVEYPYYYWP